VAEWFKAHAWKVCVRQKRTVGSNPTPSVLPFAGSTGDIHPTMAAPPNQTSVLDARAFDRTLRRMADEIVELNNGTDDLVIVGIQRRGVQLAAQIVSTIAERESAQVPQGALDITLYRDDLQTVGPRPVVGQTRIPVDVDGVTVVIVDDVLYTGRTIRAALDELADFGRPKRIALAVLIDRGGRELPIQPDIVGKTISATPQQRVDVLVEELDGKNGVVIAERDSTA
jgi:pyrimidine operon attenuation protein / uracil phosphoribosyltransferase